MGINVIWKNEEGVELGGIRDPAMILSRHVQSSTWPGTTCLRFIDAYGDAIFNQRQIPILVQEFEDSLRTQSEETTREHVKKIISVIDGSARPSSYVRLVCWRLAKNTSHLRIVKSSIYNSQMYAQLSMATCR